MSAPGRPKRHPEASSAEGSPVSSIVEGAPAYVLYVQPG